MTSRSEPSACDFLCVDDFLATELDARAIRSAFETRLIQALTAKGVMEFSALLAETRMDSIGLRLLTELLESNKVIEQRQGRLALTPAFVHALRYRDLLEARIDFADLAWPDIHGLFTALLTDLPKFMAESKVFDLFRYDRCIEVTPENMAATQTWVRLTTCLTKYEAEVVLDAVDLADAGRLLDIGGNSGEFALRACRRHTGLRATVADLPVVCAIGEAHIAGTAAPGEAARIRFVPTDFRRTPLPAGADVVSLKSVLHDWPDGDAERLLERAAAAVAPQGRIVIFERGPIEARGRKLPYSMVPNLVFVKFLRSTDLYLDKLRRMGFTDLQYRRVELEMGFHLVVASRPPA